MFKIDYDDLIDSEDYENEEFIKVKCCVCDKKIAYSEEEECYYPKLDKYICSLECEEEHFEKKSNIIHISSYFNENKKEVKYDSYYTSCFNCSSVCLF